jgi:DNA-binding CsgD family transcriptional regulator
MKFDNSHFNAVPSPPRFTHAVDKLNRLQTELVSEALRRAVGDVNAAMAHQLGEPLTALLLYLHEIKQAAEWSDAAERASVSLREIIDMALHEAERVCDIVEQAVKSGETDADTAVARGREAIDMWAWDSQVRAGGAGLHVDVLANLQPLTPREEEVLALVKDGSSNKEGGHRLGISTRTFEAHRAHLMGKLGARNVADLIRKTSSRNG